MSKKNSDSETKIYSPTNGIPGLGLALGGGMARGFAHIGVLKTLMRHGIYPSIIGGTSIGSVVGACYLTEKIDELEEWARSLNRMRILSYLDFRVRSAGLIGGKKLNLMLEEHFKDVYIEDLPHPFIAIACDLLTGHEAWLRKGDLVEAITASFALPGVFPPVERNNRFLIDGALVNPCPVSPCQAMGARMTIAVDLNADLIGKAAKPGQKFQTIAGFDLLQEQEMSQEEKKKLKGGINKRLFRREDNNPSLFGVMISSLSIVQDRLTRSRLAGEPPDVHIKPYIGHIGLLEFEKAGELIREGEQAAERAIPEIKAAMDVFLHHK